jgi:hypothetical protein
MPSMSKRVGLAAALAGLLGACSNDSGGRFFIVQNQVPQAGCVINTNRTIYEGDGLLDVSLVGDAAFAYLLFPLIQNDFPATGGNGAPEPNRLFVRAFRVRVEAGDGAPANAVQVLQNIDSSEQTHSLLEFQEPWAATIEPGGGLLAAGVGAIPGEVARRLLTSRVLDGNTQVPLIIRLRAVGKRRDGELESDEFVYPIKVCDGCLSHNIGTCPRAPVNLGNPCNAAQDFDVDCCQAGADLICPAIK